MFSMHRSRFAIFGLVPGARRFATAVLLAALVAVPTAASAAPVGAITEFSAGLEPGASPRAIAPGPDGNLWFVDQGVTKAIGRVTPNGTITEFSEGLSGGALLVSIAPGPDGNLWFTNQGATKAIGRITPSGSIEEFTAGVTFPISIAPGPDGNLWFTDGNFEGVKSIGRITPSGTVTSFSAGLNPGSLPRAIAPGPDGNLWFTDQGATKAIGRVNPNGTITEFSAGLNEGAVPTGIAPGPDGNLWFTDQGATKAIGRITPSGTITEFSTGLLPNSKPIGIAPGPDGNLWFTDAGGAPEQQLVEIAAESGLGGTYELSFGGQTTGWSGSGTVTCDGTSTTITGVSTTTGELSDGEQLLSTPATCIAPGTTIASSTATTITLSQPTENNANSGSASMTADLPYNATSTQVREALMNLSSIGPGNLLVFGGGEESPIKFTVIFFGALINTDVEPMTCDATGLTGTSPTCTVVTTADGASNMVGRISPSGSIAEFSEGLNSGSAPGALFPGGIAPGSDGNLWFVDPGSTVAIGRLGAGAPDASLRAPGVVGSLQEQTQQTCGEDRWASWAGSQPFDGGLLESSTTPPAVEWFLDGNPVGNARTYTPGAGSAGKVLSCAENVTYRYPLGVTVPTASAPVTVLKQSQGEPGKDGKAGKDGENGKNGATGATGPTGAPGANGANGAQGPVGSQGSVGPAGRDAKVTCTVKKKGAKVKVTCKVQMVASASSSGLRWRLMRGGNPVRHGATASDHLRLGNLRHGRYVLRVQGDTEGTAIVVH